MAPLGREQARQPGAGREKAREEMCIIRFVRPLRQWRDLLQGEWRESVRVVLAVAAVSLVGIAALWFFSRTQTDPDRPALGPAESAENTARWITSAGSFTPGKMLLTVLQSASVPPREASGIVQALTPLINPRTLNEGDRYELIHSTEGQFHQLSIARKLERFVVEAAPTGLIARREPIPLQTLEKSAGGRLTNSLWLSMRAQDMDPMVIVELADIFAWSIDFLTETRSGDRFALSWKEQRTPDGKLVDVRILGAIYDGKATGRHTATRFMDDYYESEGQSLRKAFLHAPLNFRRISSGFSTRRFHPIFRIYRPHLGTDYSAPTGTPVVTVGDGSVIFRGKKGGFGNLVQVRHNGTYVTYYGHLSRFAKGVGVGDRVKQGQVIGYVGSTGISTGPHLHFQIMKNGSMVNFLTLKMPSLGSVPAARMKAFKDRRDSVIPDLEKRLPPPTEETAGAPPPLKS